ncbi:MAG TPA: putative nucleotide-diphospho-sugar transferase [Chlamydiales bacterium]|nr:putative nucleotide-diphospho-sugar transferase [Chlamydiales bacterium]
MEPLIISYYTSGTLYEKDALALQESCQKVGVEWDIEAVELVGNWGENTCYKPEFILRKLLQHKRDLFWIDSDAVLLQKPALLDTIDCDLAVRIYPDREDRDPFKVNSGTIYVKHSPEAIALLHTWIEVCQSAIASCPPNEEVIDQVCLKAVLQHLPHKARVQSLPPTYNAIFDAREDQFPPGEIVVRHYQASRLYKKFINEGIFPFLQDLSIENLRDLRPRINY